MTFKMIVDGHSHEIEVIRRRPHLVVRIEGREVEIADLGDVADGSHTLEIAGRAVMFTRAHAGHRQLIRFAGRTFDTHAVDPRSEAENAAGALDHIKAPMPGAVVSVHKAVGDGVKRGETIVTIESMKLQTALIAPRDGVVAALLRAVGETFEKDDEIVQLEPSPEEA